MARLKKWKCAICGEDLIEGQRFAYLPGRGYAHIECLYQRIAETGLDRDTVALMDANEVLVYAIVRLKEAARIAASEKVSSEIASVRRSIEGLAERLEKLLAEKM